jgi:hypothetical protein
LTYWRPCGQNLAQLFDAPLVERIAEARAQAVAGEVEPQPLVLRRAPPTPRALQQGVEERAQQRHVPVVALAEQMLELTAQAPDLLAVDRLRAARRRYVRPTARRRQSVPAESAPASASLRAASPRNWNSSNQRRAASSLLTQCISSVPTSVIEVASVARRTFALAAAGRRLDDGWRSAAGG